ncbi:condensation domain-containing protein [Pyxidicoccus sp. 3LG]
MSFAQERLWRFFQRAPESSAYNIPRAFRLSGRLEPRQVEAAFQALIARHESLRVTYSEEEGVPVQRIQPPADFQLREVDLRGREDREEEAMRDMLASALRPFDLTRGPLMHASLLRLGDEEHLLFFCIATTSAADGWVHGRPRARLGAALHGPIRHRVVEAGLGDRWPSSIPTTRRGSATGCPARSCGSGSASGRRRSPGRPRC